jgi:hypothetical protein
MATDGSPAASGLERFAKTNELKYSDTVERPSEGATLDHGGSIQGGATGKLPGGETGSVVYYTYTTTDSDDHTETHHRTVAWTNVPESVGFAPYLSSGLTFAQKVKQFKLDDDRTVLAYEGTSESWLRQLFSPSLLDYLSRSPDDESWELASGVFYMERDGHIADPSELNALCADLAHVAGAIRKESLEEVDSGSAAAAAAKDADADPAMEAALAKVKLDASPASVSAAKPDFRSYVMKRPSEWLTAIGVAILITLVINIPAAAIPILLAVNGVVIGLIVFEGLIFSIVAFFAIRGRFRDESKQYAEEAFYRGYAADRHLKLTPPLAFSATHAEAGLGFKPDRVLEGELPGGASGALVFCGDGTDRESKIAIVAGPKGPVASAELRSSPEGLAAKDLDDFSARLAEQLASSSAGATS